MESEVVVRKNNSVCFSSLSSLSSLSFLSSFLLSSSSLSPSLYAPSLPLPPPLPLFTTFPDTRLVLLIRTNLHVSLFFSFSFSPSFDSPARTLRQLRKGAVVDALEARLELERLQTPLAAEGHCGRRLCAIDPTHPPSLPSLSSLSLLCGLCWVGCGSRSLGRSSLPFVCGQLSEKRASG